MPRLAIALSLLVPLSGCELLGLSEAEKGDPPPPGTTCSANGDCPDGQLCVASACRLQEGSVAGRAYAAAAHAKLEQGSAASAASLYGNALNAYKQAKAQPPPDVLCFAAVAALRAASSPDARERAARRADRCFRHSLPGTPAREQAAAAVARLRYDGLDLGAFDEPKPPRTFFTKEPRRPTPGRVEVSLELSDVDEPAFDDVAKGLKEGDIDEPVSKCFVKQWQSNHAQSMSATLTLEVESKLRDMGTYDLYPVEAKVTASDGSKFGSCVAKAFTPMVSESTPRDVGRRMSWTHELKVSARMP